MSTAPELDGRRAVRERNAGAILGAAIEVLNADPQAAMGEIAARAGVGRATLYRHYPAREDLLAAIEQRAGATFHALLAELEHGTGAPAAALERFVAGLLALREGYACILASVHAKPAHAARDLWAPLERYVGRLQADGAIDPELTPAWVVAALRGLLRAAVVEVEAGELPRADAPALVVRSLLGGVALAR